jgi:hypothetical protein
MARDLMDVVSRVRPEPVQPDDDWSTRELDRILAMPGRRRRRWTVPVAVGVGAAVIFGGAYAGGLIPDAVVDRLGGGDKSDPVYRIGEIREVFDVTIEDGTRLQLFMAPNDGGGQCMTLAHDLTSDTKPEDLSYECWLGGITPRSANGIDVHPISDDGTGPWIMYGVALDGFSLPAGTESVRVAGPGFEWTSDIDGAEGWAVELPDVERRTEFRAEFLDSAGQVLRTSVQPVGRA